MVEAAVVAAGAQHQVTEEAVVEVIRTVEASGVATEEATEAVIVADSGEAIVVVSEVVTAVEASEEGTGAEEGVAHRESQEGESLSTSFRLHMCLQLPHSLQCLPARCAGQRRRASDGQFRGGPRGLLEVVDASGHGPAHSAWLRD